MGVVPHRRCGTKGSAGVSESLAHSAVFFLRLFLQDQKAADGHRKRPSETAVGLPVWVPIGFGVWSGLVGGLKPFVRV